MFLDFSTLSVVALAGADTAAPMVGQTGAAGFSQIMPAYLNRPRTIGFTVRKTF